MHFDLTLCPSLLTVYQYIYNTSLYQRDHVYISHKVIFLLHINLSYNVFISSLPL